MPADGTHGAAVVLYVPYGRLGVAGMLGQNPTQFNHLTEVDGLGHGTGTRVGRFWLLGGWCVR